MSNDVLPALPGRQWQIEKSPRFATRLQRSVSLRESSARFAALPLYDISLSFGWLRQKPGYTEYSTLEGFFLAHYGSWDTFLVACPDDCEARNQQIGTGDGITRRYQLTRSRGAWTEPVANVDAGSIIGGRLMWDALDTTPMWDADDETDMWHGYDYGSGDYTLSSTGLMTFNHAPPADVPVYWSGTYYFRCRFADDTLPLNRILAMLWDGKKVPLVGCLGTKLA